ncbi:MAG: hypothetical protein K8R58_00515, partial [Bacteroidales bacterium]|nr:hypothetical protein [Bacteroidales bacterium]
FNIDQANSLDLKRLKKYNKKGWPRMYFMDSDESIKYFQSGCGFDKNPDEYLEMWKRYEELESEWEKLKKRIKLDPINYNDLKSYIMFGRTNSEIQFKLSYQFGFRKIIHRYFSQIDINQWSNEKNWPLYNYFGIKADEFKYLEKYQNTIDLFFINNWTWCAYEKTDDRVILKKAYFWSTVMIKRERDLAFMLDTHAKLAAKIGKKKEAEMIEREIKNLKFKELTKNCMNGVCKKPKN